MPEHSLSFWDGRWWCSCEAQHVITDVDAETHYSNAELERNLAREWIRVVNPDEGAA